MRFDVETISKATTGLAIAQTATLRFDVETISKATKFFENISVNPLRFDVETISKATAGQIVFLVSCCGLM